MALFPCNVGGGGTLSETVLWTNPSPTASFAGQTITLSSDINNFKYLKIVCKLSTSNNTESSVMYAVDDFKNLIIGVGSLCGGLLGRPGGTNLARRLGYASDTSIRFMQSGGIGLDYTDNNSLIPLAIYGMK